MSDPDYWKRLYQDTWAQASSKEQAIARLIEKETGLEVELAGMGAGSTECLSGSAASRGHHKGEADLHVVGTNIHLEVTGPLTKNVDDRQPLWIRPDKIQEAERKAPAIETWVIHHLAKDNTLRVIRLDQEFFALVKRGVLPTIRRTIRGADETYVAIPANHPYVRSWEALIERLRQR